MAAKAQDQKPFQDYLVIYLALIQPCKHKTAEENQLRICTNCFRTGYNIEAVDVANKRTAFYNSKGANQVRLKELAVKS